MTQAFCEHCSFLIDLKAPGIVDRFCDLSPQGEPDCISAMACCPKVYPRREVADELETAALRCM